MLRAQATPTIDTIFAIADQLIVSAQEDVGEIGSGQLILTGLRDFLDTLTPNGMVEIQKNLINAVDRLLISTQRRLKTTQDLVKNITNLIGELRALNGTIAIPPGLVDSIFVIADQLIISAQEDVEEIGSGQLILSGVMNLLDSLTPQAIKNLGIPKDLVRGLTTVVNQLLASSQSRLEATQNLLKNITDLIGELRPMNGKITIPTNLVNRLFPLGG